MSTVDPQLTLVRADPSRTEDAISALLAAGPAAAARFARQAELSKVPLDRIWCLADGAGRYRLAVLAVPTLGRTAMLLASHPKNRAEVPMLGSAIDAAALGCADGCDIAQTLVEPARELDIAAFEAGGLQRMATLEYLERNLPRTGAPEAHQLPAGWTISSVSDAKALASDDPASLGGEVRAEIVRVLEESYVDTRDCPGLAGMRRTEDVLDGHFAIGPRPRFWLVARKNGVAHGVCLMNASPDAASAELVYLGVARSARGSGIAKALLLEGLRACALARIALVSLAVDELNDPARRLYSAAGFKKVSSRVALVRPLARRA